MLGPWEPESSGPITQLTGDIGKINVSPPRHFDIIVGYTVQTSEKSGVFEPRRYCWWDAGLSACASRPNARAGPGSSGS